MTDQKLSKGDEGVTLEDLHPTYRKIAVVIGISNALKFGREFEGQSLYIPKVDAAIKVKTRHETIFREFNGHNYKELAKKYELSEAWVRLVIKRHRKAK